MAVTIECSKSSGSKAIYFHPLFDFLSQASERNSFCQLFSAFLTRPLNQFTLNVKELSHDTRPNKEILLCHRSTILGRKWLHLFLSPPLSLSLSVCSLGILRSPRMCKCEWTLDRFDATLLHKHWKVTCHQIERSVLLFLVSVLCMYYHFSSFFNLAYSPLSILFNAGFLRRFAIPSAQSYVPVSTALFDNTRLSWWGQLENNHHDYVHHCCQHQSIKASTNQSGPNALFYHCWPTVA